MEFLANARRLQIESIRRCSKFPKRYSFYLAIPIADAARRVYEGVKKANSIYPVNSHEAQMRRDHLLEANAELYSMISQVEVACELFCIDMDSMREWMELVDTEIRLVKAVMKADRERYQALP